MKTRKELIKLYMNGHWNAVNKLASKKQLLADAKDFADRMLS